MSRIGKKPIALPKGVTAQVSDGVVEVKGPKGSLRQPLPPGILFELADGQLNAKTEREDKALGKFHGLGRTLVANAVLGVTEGFKKELDIVGVGYRAEAKGRQVVFALGYSHPVVFDIPQGIDVAVTTRRTSRSPASTGSWSARSRRTSAGCASPTPTSRRACGTRARC